MVKSFVKGLVGRRGLRAVQRLKREASLRREFSLDRRRYRESSFAEDHLIDERLHGRNLEAQLTKDYHRVEKGLSLPAPKRPFGADVERRLHSLLSPSVSGELDHEVVDHAASALEALRDWNSGGDGNADVISPRVDAVDRGIRSPEEFFGSRHSVRNFSDLEVSSTDLERAVTLALSSPSVCNRQAWTVRMFRDAEAISVLGHQNGNAGFRDNIPVVALVTVDARLFAGAGERNQGWIEGGIFSMSLVWALHALGLESCMLNLSLTNGQTESLRAATRVEEHELIIMMIAIGHGAATHRRARSPRRAAAEVIAHRGHG